MHCRPRGAFNIPKDGPVIFVCGPHANQFLDPLLLFSEVRKEAHRRVAVLTAAKVSLFVEYSLLIAEYGP
jgi:glycerol-3-phosphate O-acyltransferase/dihydroxyacetone phosphate acyltransferase